MVQEQFGRVAFKFSAFSSQRTVAATFLYKPKFLFFLKALFDRLSMPSLTMESMDFEGLLQYKEEQRFLICNYFNS